MVMVNLIPENVQLAQARRFRLKRWGMSIALAVGIASVPTGVDWYRQAKASELHSHLDQLRAQLVTIRADGMKLATGADQAGMQLERADALRSKRAWSAVFETVDRCMPDTCWLTSVATNPAAPAAGGRRSGATSRNTDTTEESATVVIEAPRELKITGKCPTDAEPNQFVTNLKETTVFDNVKLGKNHSKAVLDGIYFEFELTCEW